MPAPGATGKSGLAAEQGNFARLYGASSGAGGEFSPSGKASLNGSCAAQFIMPPLWSAFPEGAMCVPRLCASRTDSFEEQTGEERTAPGSGQENRWISTNKPGRRTVVIECGDRLRGFFYRSEFFLVEKPVEKHAGFARGVNPSIVPALRIHAQNSCSGQDVRHAREAGI
jgi:hypothetical protein